METKSVPYSFRKNGIFYFTRRVPRDLRAHYTKKRIAFSLKTRSAKMALAHAQATSTKLDQHWHFLRLSNFEHPAFDAFSISAKKRSSSPHQRVEAKSRISQIIQHYLKHKGQNKGKTFQTAIERAFRYLKESSKKIYLEDFKKVDATYLFPRYITDGVCYATHASNALNKWLKKAFDGLTAHCLRHTFRDRLRAVECPMDLIDQIGGWKSVSSTGNSYGKGYDVDKLTSWIKKVQLQISRKKS